TLVRRLAAPRPLAPMRRVGQDLGVASAQDQAGLASCPAGTVWLRPDAAGRPARLGRFPARPAPALPGEGVPRDRAAPQAHSRVPTTCATCMWNAQRPALSHVVLTHPGHAQSHDPTW